jgi:hypothetical protein
MMAAIDPLTWSRGATEMKLFQNSRDHVACKLASFYVEPSIPGSLNVYIPRQRLLLQVEIRL